MKMIAYIVPGLLLGYRAFSGTQVAEPNDIKLVVSPALHNKRLIGLSVVLYNTSKRLFKVHRPDGSATLTAFINEEAVPRRDLGTFAADVNELEAGKSLQPVLIKLADLGVSVPLGSQWTLKLTYDSSLAANTFRGRLTPGLKADSPTLQFSTTTDGHTTILKPKKPLRETESPTGSLMGKPIN